MEPISVEWIEKHRPFQKEISDEIWFLPETGYQETKSADLVRKTLPATLPRNFSVRPDLFGDWPSISAGTVIRKQTLTNLKYFTATKPKGGE